MRSKLQVLSCVFSGSISMRRKSGRWVSWNELLWPAVLSAVDLVGCLGPMGRTATSKEGRSSTPRELQVSWVC